MLLCLQDEYFWVNARLPDDTLLRFSVRPGTILLRVESALLRYFVKHEHCNIKSIDGFRILYELERVHYYRTIQQNGIREGDVLEVVRAQVGDKLNTNTDSALSILARLGAGCCSVSGIRLLHKQGSAELCWMRSNYFCEAVNNRLF